MVKISRQETQPCMWPAVMDIWSVCTCPHTIACIPVNTVCTLHVHHTSMILQGNTDTCTHVDTMHM